MESLACISSREEMKTSRRAPRTATRLTALNMVVEVKPIWRDFSTILSGERSVSQSAWKDKKYL